MRLISAQTSHPAPAWGKAADDHEESLAALFHGLESADAESAVEEVPRRTHGGRYRVAVVAVSLLLPFMAGAIASSSGAASGATLPTESPTAVSTAETETVSASIAPDTREDVLRPGQAISVGRWRVELDPVEWDQTARILEKNIAPPAIPDGYGWALVRMTVENVGTMRAAPGMIEVVLHAGGWQVSHRDQADGTVRIPDFFAAHDLEPGEGLSGSLGFWVPTRAASDPDCVLELRVRATPTADPTVQRIACNT